MTKILICGPYPEPVGGISIHICRLGLLLKNQGFDVFYCDESRIFKTSIFNIRSLNIKSYISLLINSDIIHIHSSVGLFRLIHLFISSIFLKKTIVTIHSWRAGKLSSFIWSWILRINCHRVVFVSSEVSEKLHLPSSIKLVFPAFIPSIDQQYEIPEKILEFIGKSKLGGRKIVVSNAFRLIDFDGSDLYGIDLCINAFESVIINKSAVLVFVISDPSVNPEKISYYIDYVRRKNLEETVLIYLGIVNFWGLLQISDFSIRATNTDGDALSIRESIFLKKPCIASDVVSRPELTILFKTKSCTSLIKELQLALTHDFRNYFPKESFDNQIDQFYADLYI